MSRTSYRRPGVGLLCLAGAVLPLLVVVASHASAKPSCTIYWTGRVSSDWSTTGNWSLTDGGPSAGRTPASSDAVCMSTSPGTDDVDQSATVTIGTLSWPRTAKVSPTLTNSGSLTLAGAGASTLYSLQDSGIVTAATTSSTLSITTLQLSGTLHGPGTFSVSGAASVSEGFVENTTLVLRGATVITEQGLALADDGVPANVEVAGTMTLTDAADVHGGTGTTLSVDPGGTISFPGTADQEAYLDTDQVANDGTVATTGGTLFVQGSGTDTGTFSAGAGATLDLDDDRTEQAGALITGAGTILVDGIVEFASQQAQVTATGPIVVQSRLVADSSVDVVLPDLDATGELFGPGSFTVTGTATLDSVIVADTTVLLHGSSEVTGNGVTLRDDTAATTVEIAGTLTLDDDADVEGNAGTALLVDAGGTVRYPGSDADQVAILDTAVTDHGILASTGGTLNVDQLTNLSAAGALTGGAYLAVGGTLALPNPVTKNAGSITVGPKGALTGGGSDLFSTLKATSGALTLGRAVTFKKALTNSGAVTVSAGTTQLPSYTQSAGTTGVAAGATLRAAKGAGHVAIGGGVLTGNGTVAGVVSGAGTVAPGRAAGPLTVGGYGMGGSSTLAVGISGSATVGTDFGQLAVTGKASLGGTLAITSAPGYLPPVGTTYTVLTAASVSGTFATVTGTVVGSHHYVVSYTGTAVRLTVQ